MVAPCAGATRIRYGFFVCMGLWPLRRHLMDEHIVLDHGEVRQLVYDRIYEIPKSLSEWTQKHNWYADRECIDISRMFSVSWAWLDRQSAGRGSEAACLSPFALFHRAFSLLVLSLRPAARLPGLESKGLSIISRKPAGTAWWTRSCSRLPIE